MTTQTDMPDNIPVLEPAQRIRSVPERLRVALDAKVMEKSLLDQLVAQWLQALKPEMERMAHQIVRNSAEAYLRQRAHSSRSVSRSDSIDGDTRS